MLYPLLRSVAFRFDPEFAHGMGMTFLKLTHRRDRPHWLAGSVPACPVRVMGLDFPNPVGLAAGLDKNGEYIDPLGALGFGFLELGTVTPRPQPGNPRPRLFRILSREAIINRMGFNNKGIDHLVEQVQRARYKGIIGINIGKNADTPIENAADDYLKGLRMAYPHADYIAINISSPNTKNLRTLQEGDSLARLLESLRNEQDTLATAHGHRVPLALKLAPDLNDDQLQEAARLLLHYSFDAVIATNTTLARDAVQGCKHASEAGGLSGAPLRARSVEVIRALHSLLGGKIPIIGVGGIFSGDDAQEKLNAGARLVQIFTGFIYRGPTLVADIVRKLASAS